MVGDWNIDIAAKCMGFYMRAKYPEVVARIEVVFDAMRNHYITQIAFKVKEEPFAVTFPTEIRDFNSKSYFPPDETKAQLMMLLG